MKKLSLIAIAFALLFSFSVETRAFHRPLFHRHNVQPQGFVGPLNLPLGSLLGNIIPGLPNITIGGNGNNATDQNIYVPRSVSDNINQTIKNNRDTKAILDDLMKKNNIGASSPTTGTTPPIIHTPLTSDEENALRSKLGLSSR